MKKLVLITVVAAGIATGAFAQTATFSFNDNNGTPNAGVYHPGDSFTFAINLAFTPGGNIANLAGLSYWFQQSTPSAPFYFSITNRDISGSQFTFLQTSSLSYPQTLSPTNSKDLGASTLSGSGVGAGNYFIANLTVSISDSATPGDYFIENTTTSPKISVIASDAGHTFPIPQATYEIQVVPEPATWVGCGLVAALLCAGIVHARIRRAKVSR
jgi:hypothetical protein